LCVWAMELTRDEAVRSTIRQARIINPAPWLDRDLRHRLRAEAIKNRCLKQSRADESPESGFPVSHKDGHRHFLHQAPGPHKLKTDGKKVARENDFNDTIQPYQRSLSQYFNVRPLVSKAWRGRALATLIWRLPTHPDDPSERMQPRKRSLVGFRRRIRAGDYGASASTMRHSAIVPCRHRPISPFNSRRRTVRSAILRSTSARCSRAIASTD
jgi:hypothetical protein